MRIKYGYMGKSGEFVLPKNKIGSYGKRKKERMTLTSWIIHGKFTFRSKPEGLILLCHC